MAVNSLFLHPSRNSTLKKDSRTNQAAAPNAVQQEKHRAEMVAIRALNVKCSLLFVLLVAKKPQYLSNLLVTNLFIAGIATNPAPETTGNLIVIRPFRVSYPGGFLF
ncbi:hypothetical protein A7D23_02095 [Dehalobacter sp. TeCB1]|uniref:Uncharacterized protein n=1 Tax=Dehalobacter restrictus (strain DSM 9455 / PER-K23) TaxID=871738 RepID=A0ABM5PB72_DEHRP|nr:hypothetical protein DEHRE_13435 [Dehalobacter restrictus DSM 9455]OCZ49645.1 hypothetical protein A7D23_02095 [Dehalobacter sp. TeCB1]